MTAKRNIYLDTVPISQAVEKLKNRLQRKEIISSESVPTHQAAGQTTSKPVYAKYSSPTFHSAAMDGIAVKAEDTFTAREGNPLQLRYRENYFPVNTGDPLPKNTDAVIMIEQVEQLDNETVAIETPAFPWQHIRRIGEDIVATELIFSQNHTLNAYDIGALLSAGVWEIEIWQQPHIYIIPTGDEVLDFTQQPEPDSGQVIESNSQVMRILAQELRCKVTRIPPVPDDEDQLNKALQTALSSDAHLIIVGAGSSAGSKDFTRKAMENFGEILVHGIAAMPGKPSLLGVAGNKILAGAPGYPVSAVICFEQLVKPLLFWLSHKIPVSRPKIPVRLTRKVPSKLGQEEFLRLCIGNVGDRWIGTPLPRGAGLITSLTKAQGITKIPASSEGLETEKIVDAELLVSQEYLEQIMVCVGSHDNTIDLLTNELMGLEDPIILASTHLGSIGGLTAIKQGTAHIAGSHLFDPETQDYNFPFLQKYLPDIKVNVVNLAIRHQGLILAAGNPKQIEGIQDLTRKEVRFINRQKGAGTRILFDDHLQKAQIKPEQILGYAQEEYTHMAVAANILSGAADCGMGIYAAAKALNLDFIPLAKERYDLIIPEQFMQNPKIQTLFELINKDNIKEKIKNLGGYETDLTGQIMQPNQGLKKA